MKKYVYTSSIVNFTIQPVIQSETLDLLEWQRLCQHLSTFAATKLGAVAARYLTIPKSKEESLNLLAQTKEIYHLEQQIDNGWTFTGIEDIGDSLERAKIGSMLSGEELLNLATTLSGVRRLRRVIDVKEDLPTLAALIEDLRTYPELEQEIHHCIDDRAEVTDRASPGLAEIRSSIKTIRDRIYQILQGILQRQSGAIQEAVITQRGDRFVIPVKAPQKDAIPGIVHDISSTGSTLYIEPKSIIELGNKLRQNLRQEQREIEAILNALTAKVSAVYEDLEKLLAIATSLDLATAKARYSNWLEANPPRFTESQESITLRQLRHPLLVWQQKHEQGISVIPIDILIKPQIRVVAITGPNTGGKTVTLKTLGLAALMAKTGIFVPAKEPVEIPWFQGVLADIGDEQSLQQSLSTFSGHVKRIGRIIEELGECSDLQNYLILFDEVGAGTDPAEGSALAIALLKYLASRALLTIASTHYGELKALKYQDERFENASVEFDDRSLKPTYRLLWGIPGRSNALSIALRLGLKPEIVEIAKNNLGGNSEDINHTIAALEAQRREQEEKAQEAKKLLQKTEQFYTEVSEKAAYLQSREKELKLSQEQAVREAIATAKTEIAKVIRELQQGKPTAQDAQKATEALNEIASRHISKPEDKKTQLRGYQPQVGERIRLTNLGQTAEVLTAADDNGDLTVRFGLMKMKISLADIESLDGKKGEIPVKQPKNIPLNPPIGPKIPVIVRTSQNTIDLRGSRVSNAEPDLERAISRATEAGILWIVHGKGTGRLREGIHEFLKLHPQVERFELAPREEGGAGVTIVYLQ
jgi:DNA mismatch repair protein MutS2